MSIGKIVKLDPETEKTFSQFIKDSKWINRNYSELIEKYDHRWVAIREEKVRYYNKDFLKLLELMRKAGEDPAQWLVDYIHSEPIYYCLQNQYSPSALERKEEREK